MAPEDELWEKAEQRAADKAGFLIHLSAYAAVNVFLALMWFVTTGGMLFPWFLIPLFGWGIGIAIHFVAVFIEPNFVDWMALREYEILQSRRGT